MRNPVGKSSTSLFTDSASLLEVPSTSAPQRFRRPRRHVLLLSVYCVALGLAAQLAAGKQTYQYRMEKVNMVWQKAQSRLHGKAVFEKLQKELVVFDNLYLSIKQDEQHHKTVRSLSEVDDKLEKLLERYDLDDVLRAFRLKYKYDSKKSNAESPKPDKAAKLGHRFNDARLEGLWAQVKDDEDISTEELDSIFRQLTEQQKKLEDYEVAIRDLKQLNENRVHDTIDYQELVRKTKRLNQEIEDTFEHLDVEVKTVKENPFENLRVRALWQKARKSPKLIPNELNAIKGELRHLDRFFLKLDHHEAMLTEHANLNQDVSLDVVEDEMLEQYRDQQDKMVHKLKKLETYLTEKLRHHEEL